MQIMFHCSPFWDWSRLYLLPIIMLWKWAWNEPRKWHWLMFVWQQVSDLLPSAFSWSCLLKDYRLLDGLRTLGRPCLLFHPFPTTQSTLFEVYVARPIPCLNHASTPGVLPRKWFAFSGGWSVGWFKWFWSSTLFNQWVIFNFKNLSEAAGFLDDCLTARMRRSTPTFVVMWQLWLALLIMKTYELNQNPRVPGGFNV